MDNLKKKHVKKLEDHFKKNKQKEEEWVQKYHKGKNRPMAHIHEWAGLIQLQGSKGQEEEEAKRKKHNQTGKEEEETHLDSWTGKGQGSNDVR